MTALEDKSLDELLAMLTDVPPSFITALKDRIGEHDEEIYSKGYSNGLDEGMKRATVPDEDFLLRGEAKGLTWASHATSGGQMAPNNNPYVSPRIIERLLAIGEKTRADKAKQ
jgi:hypothetical protein